MTTDPRDGTLIRLEPIEVYVLDSFRLEGRSWLRLDEILGGCTVNRRHALDGAVARLEVDSLIIRTFEFVELTEAGEQYLSMAGAEAKERRLEEP